MQLILHSVYMQNYTPVKYLNAAESNILTDGQLQCGL